MLISSNSRRGTYTGFLRNPPAGVHHENREEEKESGEENGGNGSTGVFCMTSSRVLLHDSKQQGKYFAADIPMKNSRNRDDNDKIVSIFSIFSPMKTIVILSFFVRFHY